MNDAVAAAVIDYGNAWIRAAFERRKCISPAARRPLMACDGRRLARGTEGDQLERERLQTSRLAAVAYQQPTDSLPVHRLWSPTVSDSPMFDVRRPILKSGHSGGTERSTRLTMRNLLCKVLAGC